MLVVISHCVEQRRSDLFFSVCPGRGLSSEHPDLLLKSLLAGLTLPVKTGSSDSSAEDRDGKLIRS